jgi:hypothetical protein
LRPVDIASQQQTNLLVAAAKISLQVFGRVLISLDNQNFRGQVFPTGRLHSRIARIKDGKYPGEKTGHFDH